MISVTVLGATGSVGMSTARVLEQHADRFEVAGLSARSDWRSMLKLCLRLNPGYAAMESASSAEHLAEALKQHSSTTEVIAGPGAAEQLAAKDADTLVAAISGMAGLAPVRAGIARGARILLANKEALIVGGSLLLDEIHASGAKILPLDSEHNALFQCLGGAFRPGEPPEGVVGMTLTASGGPFLRTPIDRLESVTPAQAVRHPTWKMGSKISVDSATLMNKGMELIEAAILFGLPAEKLQVLVHPQSLVHALVSFADSSVLAQLAHPDMRVPIANALAWPQRLATEVPALDLAQLPDLQFERPDTDRFPCLDLARKALLRGGTAPVILNAANEQAVAGFLDGTIGFQDIAGLIAEALDEIPATACDNFEQLLELDSRTRSFCNGRMQDGVRATVQREQSA